MENRKTLDEIGLQYSTDKVSTLHGYLPKYEKFLPFDRDSSIKFLEIGVQTGDSIKTFAEYYPNADIVGIEISPASKFVEEIVKCSIRIGDQSDTSFLQSIVDEYKSFDFILDDGSHQCHHQIISFEYLFPYLTSGGIYIVEDVSTSYWEDHGGGYKRKGTAIEYFKDVVDQVNFYGEYLENPPPHYGRHIRNDEFLLQQFKAKGIYKYGFDILSLNFINSSIIITKR